MPNPGQSDLHVNAPLTNVSVRYIQDSANFIATKIFPVVPVQKQSDLFWKWSKSDWRRTDVAKRAPGTESKGSGWNMETDTYFANPYAIHKDIDDQTRANADANFKLDSDATKFVTSQILIYRDVAWCNAYFKTGVWGKEYTGVNAAPNATQFLQWDQAGSDPINDVSGWIITFEESTGFTPNKLTLGARVIKALKNHPDIIDRIKYTQRGIVTTDLLATLFGVDEIIVAKATYTTTAQLNDGAAQDAAATFSYIADSKSALLSYSPSGPSRETPSAGYVFTWDGYSAGNDQGIRVKRFRMEHLESDRVEGTMTYDMKVVSADCGVFLNTVIA